MTGVVLGGYVCHTDETRPAKMAFAVRVQQGIGGCARCALTDIMVKSTDYLLDQP